MRVLVLIAVFVEAAVGEGQHMRLESFEGFEFLMFFLLQLQN